ncbi:MAG: hypothetical protein K6G00_04425 [Treponema sp.]|nr:hypothetical protein [Treponema sp.]
MKKAFYIIYIAFTMFMISGLTACHDSIFESIENEIALDESGIRGSMGSIVEYGEYLYITPMNKGVIYRKSASATTKGGWQSISAPKTPVAVSLDGSTLYMLAVDWEEGTGDWEGYNVPKYFEYTSTNGTDWSYTGSSYSYTSDASDVPSRYKNQCCSITVGSYTYSIPSSYSTDTITVSNGTTKDVDEGYIYAITATGNSVIVGTEQGIFSMPIQSDGSLGDKTSTVAGHDTSSTFTSDVPIVYVPEAFRNVNEGDGPIYAYNSPVGSSGTTNEGLMAYFPGSGWNRDK